MAKKHWARPGVVLTDLLMPVMDGIEATGEIRREVEVLAPTGVLEEASVTGAIKAAAIGSRVTVSPDPPGYVAGQQG